MPKLNQPNQQRRRVVANQRCSKVCHSIATIGEEIGNVQWLYFCFFVWFVLKLFWPLAVYYYFSIEYGFN